MKYLLAFLINFIIIYSFYFFTVIIFKSKYKKYERSKQVSFFVKKYKLDFNKVSFVKFINLLSITNAFIMSITILLVYFIPDIVLKLLVAFVVMIVLILLFYKLLGIYIERKMKNV